MNRYFVGYKSIISCIFLIALGLASCTSTPTSDRLQLADGEIDACLLITPTELETVTGFNTVTDNYPLNPSGTSCEYRTTDANMALRIFVTTDASLKKDNRLGTTQELYDFWRSEEPKHPEIYYTVEDLESLGNQAYFSNKQNFELAIRVLYNGIYYEFTGYSTNDVDRDALIQIARIALQRAP